jgi:hypothetical protein
MESDTPQNQIKNQEEISQDKGEQSIDENKDIKKPQKFDESTINKLINRIKSL